MPVVTITSEVRKLMYSGEFVLAYRNEGCTEAELWDRAVRSLPSREDPDTGELQVEVMTRTIEEVEVQPVQPE